MRIISYILTPIKLTARLSCSTSNRRYTSLVQILQDQHKNRNLLCNELSVKRFNKTNSGYVKANENVALEKNQENTAILPIALLDLSPTSKKSSKVLLIPLNLHEADEKSMRSTLTSIFSKPKSLKKIEAFSQALKEVQPYEKFGKQTKIRKEHQDVLNAQKELKFSLKDHQLAENSNPEQQAISKDSFSRALNKSLSQCYLHSKQMFGVNAAMFSPQNSENIDLIEKVNKAELLNLTSVMKIDASKLNLKEISWYKNIPFFEVQSNSFPLTLAKKSFSTSAKALTQNALTRDKCHTKSLAHEIINANNLRFASSIGSKSKCNPNYDYPFLTKLFDTKDLLMSSNAYSQALVEAAKRRAALAESKTEDKQLKTDVYSRPIVKGIKGCDVPESQHTNEPAIKSSKPCPPPSKPKLTASNGCKKDNPCKSPECSEPCKNELEKLKQQSEENMNKQKNKMPTGCESPKCKKDNNCTKLPKSPCKKASNQQLQSKVQSPSNPPAAIKKMKDTCKKDDPCKTPECPNPCKEEMEKLKRQTEEDIIRKRNKSPTGCVSPKCKKEDACTKRTDSPCKKASNNQPIAFQQTLNCNKKVDANKAKDQKQKNPCLDEHKEYKPKCNTDPCIQDKSPCGGGAKKEPTKQPAEKGQKKENPCKTKEQGGGSKQKEEPCNKKANNPCSSKKDDSSGCGKKETPCIKDNKKEESCGKTKEQGGGSKQKEEPCNKKENNPCGSKKGDSSGCGKKENPCMKDNKKEESCGKTKEQGGGSKQKEEPCNKKENNPCGSKKDDSSGCEKKENPCKKDNKKEESCGKTKEQGGGSKQKEEPCNKKENNPCGSKKDDSSGCGKKETPCIKDNKKEESCGKKKEPCGGSKQKKEPCKKKESPCKKKETPCKKEDPCNKKSSGPCGSRKEDPCKKKNEDPCGKSKKPDSCKKEKDSCKKNKEPSKSPCTNKKEEPCKKEKEDPCKNKKSGPCVSNEKKDSCTKKPTSPCESKNDNKTECQKASSSTSTGSSTKQACGTPKKETKPNCGKSNRSFSSSVATTNNRYFTLNKRNFSTNRNLCQFGFMRRFSSKRTNNNNNSDDLGRTSKCKSVEIKVPPKRKPAYNPHPKDGLRKCYPTYDMDCTQFCKDARKTDCKKYAFLKDTDSNERKNKK